MKMIFSITMTDIVGLILRQNHYHQISQGHPTNDMSDYRALLFVIKWWQRWKSLIKMMLAMTNPGQDYIQGPGRWTQAGSADHHKHPVFLLFRFWSSIQTTIWPPLNEWGLSGKRQVDLERAAMRSIPADQPRWSDTLIFFSFILFNNRSHLCSCKKIHFCIEAFRLIW